MQMQKVSKCQGCGVWSAKFRKVSSVDCRSVECQAGSVEHCGGEALCTACNATKDRACHIELHVTQLNIACGSRASAPALRRKNDVLQPAIPTSWVLCLPRKLGMDFWNVVPAIKMHTIVVKGQFMTIPFFCVSHKLVWTYYHTGLNHTKRHHSCHTNWHVTVLNCDTWNGFNFSTQARPYGLHREQRPAGDNGTRGTYVTKASFC